MSYAKPNLLSLAVSAMLLAAPLSQANESIEVNMHKASVEGQGDLVGTTKLDNPQVVVIWALVSTIASTVSVGRIQ